jgi:CRISPR-associated protein Csc2
MLNTNFFPAAVPPRPMGHYAHIILLRETDSYALFQTDGELNTARVQAGVSDTRLLTRITMFKRKQTTPERLSGRELLRHYELISPDQSDSKAKKPDERGVQVDAAGRPICDYNVDFCKQCPDCISYGFAIGDAGSEKAKVYSDTGYSLTPYESSHEAFTLNAPYEGGTMSRQSETTSRISEQDHVRPQTLFPAVVTVRDATSALFLYVLNNVLRTRRYGAQTTRTGTVTNHVLGIVLADGELFSNLHFTQTLYDALAAAEEIRPNQPVVVSRALQVAREQVPGLINGEPIAVNQFLAGNELAGFLTDLTDRTRSATGMRELLQAAQRDSAAYFGQYIQKTKGKK